MTASTHRGRNRKRFTPTIGFLEPRALMAIWAITNPFDDGDGSLRDAAALAAPGDIFDVEVPHFVVDWSSNLGPIELPAGSTLEGNGASESGRYEPMIETSGIGNVIRNLTVTALGSAGASGPCIVNNGDLTLTNVTVHGYAPANYGTMTVADSTLTGYGLVSYGTALTLDGSALNATVGAGITNYGGSLNLINSSLNMASTNSSDPIDSYGGSVTVSNTSVFENGNATVNVNLHVGETFNMINNSLIQRGSYPLNTPGSSPISLGGGSLLSGGNLVSSAIPSSPSSNSVTFDGAPTTAALTITGTNDSYNTGENVYIANSRISDYVSGNALYFTGTWDVTGIFVILVGYFSGSTNGSFSWS